jgi:hypothetical protein
VFVLVHLDTDDKLPKIGQEVGAPTGASVLDSTVVYPGDVGVVLHDGFNDGPFFGLVITGNRFIGESVYKTGETITTVFGGVCNSHTMFCKTPVSKDIDHSGLLMVYAKYGLGLPFKIINWTFCAFWILTWFMFDIKHIVLFV